MHSTEGSTEGSRLARRTSCLQARAYVITTYQFIKRGRDSRGRRRVLKADAQHTMLAFETYPQPTAAAERQSHIGEEMALRMQIEELTSALDFVVSQRLALFMASSHATGSQYLPFHADEELGIDAGEEESLRMELEELIAQEAILKAERLEEEQHAALELSKSLASSLAQEVARDEAIAQHDHKFALALDRVSSQEWQEFGDKIEDPIEDPGVRGPIAATTHTSAASSASWNPIRLISGFCNAIFPPACDPKGKGKASLPPPCMENSAPHPPQKLARCNICFEDFPAASMVCAGRDDEDESKASTSTAAAGCGHLFCSSCMQQYVSNKIEAHQYPLLCPSSGCGRRLGHTDVSALVDDSPSLAKLLRQLEVEHAIHPSERLYCPYKDCSALLLRPEEEEEEEGPTPCMECERSFCAKCLIPGWHVGYTCKAFQALPPDMRSAEDAAMLKLSVSKRWKKCPSCCFVVERFEGCNHVRCRCGTDFCYQCGLKYTSKQATAQNVHGTPACKCDLFTVPEDNDEEEQQQPAPQALAQLLMHPPLAAVVPVMPRRGGRKVSKTRCHHSASIHHCPHRHNCWFWHDEDDQL